MNKARGPNAASSLIPAKIDNSRLFEMANHTFAPMQKPGYHVKKDHILQYEFISEGRRTITKIVQFEPLNRKGLYNIGFGDLLDDGSIDDEVESNNNDIVKVMSTIIFIIQDFLKNNPRAQVFFTGSTPQRTNFYKTILRRYYSTITEDFAISALVNHAGDNVEVDFDPNIQDEILGFFIVQKV